MTATISCAYLRVYVPLGAMRPSERRRVETHLREPASASAHRYGLGLLEADERAEVYELGSGGVQLYCPAHTRLRALLGMMAFERSMPDGVAQLFFRPGEIDEGRRELAEIQATEPEIRPHLVQSPWHVPLRWFICFEDSERTIEQGDHLRIRYRTPLSSARDRVAAAMDVLKSGSVHPSIVGMVFELQEWVSGFGSEGVVELDYASVSALFEDDELADDHSVADVWSSIKALEDSDGAKAGLYYQRVNERWARARGRETLN